MRSRAGGYLLPRCWWLLDGFDGHIGDGCGFLDKDDVVVEEIVVFAGLSEFVHAGVEEGDCFLKRVC